MDTDIGENLLAIQTLESIVGQSETSDKAAKHLQEAIKELKVNVEEMTEEKEQVSVLACF